MEDKNSGKTKSTNIPSVDVSSSKHQQFSTYQSQIDKKDQNHQQGRFWRQMGQKSGYDHDFPTTDVNASTVKKKVKDVSQVKCYNYLWKGYYTTKCPQKPKN